MINILKINDDLYSLIRIINTLEIIPEIWKEQLQVEHVFKKNNRYYFCNKIKDAKIIEEK